MFCVRKKIEKIIAEYYPGWKIINVSREYESIFSRNGGFFVKVEKHQFEAMIIVPTRLYLLHRLGIGCLSKLRFYVNRSIRNPYVAWR